MPVARQRTIVQAALVLLILAVAHWPGHLSAGQGVAGTEDQDAGTAAGSAPTPSAAKQKTTTAATAPSEDDKSKDGKASGGKTRAKGAQSIAVLVNDDPITAYEIEQRQRLIGLSADVRDRVEANFKSLLKAPKTTERLKAILNETVNAYKGKSKDEIIEIFDKRKKEYAQSLQRQAIESARSSTLPALRKQAQEELIEERLKLQEAKRLSIVIEDKDVDKVIEGIAGRNKMTPEQFATHMKGMGADIKSMRSRFQAEMAWREVIRARFGRLVAITDRDVDRLVATTQGGGGDDVELQLQRITVPIPTNIDQTLIAQRVAEAEGIVAKFKGCASTSALAAQVDGAKFDDLGTKKVSGIAEPTRSLLLNARDGEMLPPSVTQGGIELWAVCGRKAMKADEQKREVAQNELRQKEFEILAKKHMKDLRQDAAIEFR